MSISRPRHLRTSSPRDHLLLPQVVKPHLYIHVLAHTPGTMSPLSKIALLLSAAASVHALGTGWPTEGTQRGTIRVYSWGEEKEVGCVTKEGHWTVSYGYCDAFNAKALGPITVDREWTELEIRTSEGAQCWFPDNSTMELVCGSEVDDTETLWLHASDYQSDGKSIPLVFWADALRVSFR